MTTMTDSETYNGYANRETWAFNFHWQNDQGFYGETLEQARLFVREWDDEKAIPLADSQLGEHIVTHWRDNIDGYEETFGKLAPELRMFDREVGSWWRIDYKEVGEAVRESLDAES